MERTLLLSGDRCQGLKRVGLFGILLSAGALVALLRQPQDHQTVLKDGGQQTQLWSWNELGSAMDMHVPNTANANAVDVGGQMVKMHPPSGRLPGYGGGKHFVNDIMHPEKPNAPAASSFRPVRVAPEVPQQARAVHAPTLGAIEAAYRRAARLASKARSSNSPGSLQPSAGPIAQPSHGLKAETSALEKAAQSLDSVTKSLQSAGAQRPHRLAKIAASLSSLSHAMQRSEPRQRTGSEEQLRAIRHSLLHKAPESAAEQQQKEEQRIEADILYHLDQARQARALQRARTKAQGGWFDWL